ncbi:hypothetical protein FF38_01114 [Lucilia cuprina]|uniref:Uncharacterized protein n=1 Tax=Lucilia cuprina TaxID=7375 RepID=A0A0L0BZZ3_LUCCU|nr:hypothetical protein FF38_01114 [Lucilia cuprina]
MSITFDNKFHWDLTTINSGSSPSCMLPSNYLYFSAPLLAYLPVNGSEQGSNHEPALLRTDNSTASYHHFNIWKRLMNTTKCFPINTAANSIVTIFSIKITVDEKQFPAVPEYLPNLFNLYDSVLLPIANASYLANVLVPLPSSITINNSCGPLPMKNSPSMPPKPFSYSRQSLENSSEPSCRFCITNQSPVSVSLSHAT